MLLVLRSVGHLVRQRLSRVHHRLWIHIEWVIMENCWDITVEPEYSEKTPVLPGLWACPTQVIKSEWCFPFHNSNTNTPLHAIVIQTRKEAEIKPERIERLLSSLNQITETNENRNCQSRKYAITKLQENRESLELNRLLQLLVYEDDINIFGENPQIIRESKEILLDAIVLYACETWTLTLREEQRLRVFENKVLRKIFETKWDEVRGEWRKLHNAELHTLFADNMVLLAKEEMILRNMLLELNGSCEQYGMKVNANKTYHSHRKKNKEELNIVALVILTTLKKMYLKLRATDKLLQILLRLETLDSRQGAAGRRGKTNAQSIRDETGSSTGGSGFTL
ncbi:hypothetical protein ANN_02445 [Periplaneta americana]|uniref:Uncharacterized protein n=1 Tax=Periplaneta americana TaxID=6978 RepID=A0ABQ8TZS3_PERAM|nr:hypothetical protein ANN_02445 [Periplaneta americana]